MTMMNVQLDGGTIFKPGETITGQVSWYLDKRPKAARVRLFWYTMGKGTEDSQVEDQLVFDKPMQQDNRSFKFKLPVAPYSFSGTLITLRWGVELDIKGVKEVCAKEFVLSPFEKEIVL
ncbi:hypothetical protein SAMN02745216_04440 [Desulfatibacillum alkenivorans DSM 16219]|uniref:Arrestin-like N-terminal domain-containing protein n=1 Tax=Desulfatibacillum alkenivorans DSM 16219 TaxID=1121393 RepID=A0A1M6X2R6_9BACT|nr:hypothetical protein [Desulfatibacillum alkenivorans]SHJ15323.1 hypothetical protein SAMN02745216_01153 [Desulfatibacillum alkenivorans DSM 16219]SHL00139.1 hypothetical protein SAMN02745216_04440 [Desulfatibacillum alkenivorans DSM 16219]